MSLAERIQAIHTAWSSASSAAEVARITGADARTAEHHCPPEHRHKLKPYEPKPRDGMQNWSEEARERWSHRFPGVASRLDAIAGGESDLPIVGAAEFFRRPPATAEAPRPLKKPAVRALPEVLRAAATEYLRRPARKNASRDVADEFGVRAWEIMGAVQALCEELGADGVAHARQLVGKTVDPRRAQDAACWVLDLQMEPELVAQRLGLNKNEVERAVEIERNRRLRTGEPEHRAIDAPPAPDPDEASQSQCGLNQAQREAIADLLRIGAAPQELCDTFRCSLKTVYRCRPDGLSHRSEIIRKGRYAMSSATRRNDTTGPVAEIIERVLEQQQDAAVVADELGVDATTVRQVIREERARRAREASTPPAEAADEKTSPAAMAPEAPTCRDCPSPATVGIGRKRVLAFCSTCWGKRTQRGRAEAQRPSAPAPQRPSAPAPQRPSAPAPGLPRQNPADLPKDSSELTAPDALPTQDGEPDVTDTDASPAPQKANRNQPLAPAVYTAPPSMTQLRHTLFQELEDLRSGKSDPQRAIAASKLAAQIINSVGVEVDFIRATRGVE